jgi:cytochrome P450
VTDTVVYEPGTAQFQQDRSSVYRALRDEDPVHRMRDGTYVLSRFDDVWTAVHDWETFSSDHVAESRVAAPMMIYMDPPRHSSLRAIVSQAFTPRRVADLEPSVRRIVRDTLADLPERFDLASDVAAPIPSRMIAELIGVPEELRETFRTWTEAFLELASPSDGLDRFVRIYELFATLLDERRRAPTDDLMSALLAAEVDGCFLLLIAGNDTTTSLIGSGAHLLAEHPDQRAALVADPTLIPAAIEEMARLESPAQALPRTAMRDVELHGVTIPEGSRVLLCWGAANLDEREFPDAERFDVTRRAKRHLGFGHGAHYCLGASLARLEARVAFEELLAELPHYRLAGGAERYTSTWARAWRTLPIIVR